MSADGFAARLKRGRCLAAPGVFDGLSARLASQAGAEALYLTGYGVSASLLGQPDAGFLTREDMVGRITTITAVTDKPLIADADTGFGDNAAAAATARAYARAGAAAMQIEDQVFPKRCGHLPGRDVVPLADALDKLKAVLDAADGMAVIARTDARTSSGLDEAIARGAAFHEAGADIVFVESPESEEELSVIAKALPAVSLCANMVEGGRTPFLPPQRLASMGYALAIYPLIGLAASAQALARAYGTNLNESEGQRPAAMTFAELSHAVGFERAAISGPSES